MLAEKEQALVAKQVRGRRAACSLACTGCFEKKEELSGVCLHLEEVRSQLEAATQRCEEAQVRREGFWCLSSITAFLASGWPTKSRKGVKNCS